MRREKFRLIRLAILLTAVINFVACSRPSRSDTSAAQNAQEDVSPEVGFFAPDFELEVVGGGLVRLSEFRGNPVVVNFWASWCGPCRSEMPDIQAVYDVYHQQGLVILGINQEESEARVAEFAEELGLTFPLLLDVEGRVSEVYEVYALPTTFFISGDGIIRELHLGSMSRADFEGSIRAIMSVGVGQGCPGAPPQRVGVGQRARVCTGPDRLIVRDGPGRGNSEITRLVSGEQLTITYGPSCADGYSWWKVQTDDGVEGWVAEGDMHNYYLCPVQ